MEVVVSGPSYPRLSAAGSLRRPLMDWSQHVAELGDVLSDFATLVADGRAAGLPPYVPAPIVGAWRTVSQLFEAIDHGELMRLPPADRAPHVVEGFASAKDRRNAIYQLADSLYREETALLHVIKEDK